MNSELYFRTHTTQYEICALLNVRLCSVWIQITLRVYGQHTVCPAASGDLTAEHQTNIPRRLSTRSRQQNPKRFWFVYKVQNERKLFLHITMNDTNIMVHFVQKRKPFSIIFSYNSPLCVFLFIFFAFTTLIFSKNTSVYNWTFTMNTKLFTINELYLFMNEFSLSQIYPPFPVHKYTSVTQTYLYTSYILF